MITQVKRVLFTAVCSAVAACGASGSSSDAPKAAPSEAEAPVTDGAARSAYEAGADGDWEKAAVLFARARKNDPPRVELVVNHGVALERSGDMAGAVDAYEAAYALEPTHPAAASNLARALVAKKMLPRAKKVLKEALDANPDDAALLSMSASVFRLAGNGKRAAELARRVLLRDQKNVSAMKTLALVYADEGKLQLADTFFRNALKLDEKDASIYVNLGLLDYRRGEHQRALANFEQAIALDPQNATAHANVGAIALRYRDYGRAASSYRTAVEQGLVTCETTSALGYAYEGAQNGAEAVERLKQAYELCPDDAELLYSVGSICMAQLQDNGCALDFFTRYTQSKKALAKDHPVYLMIESLEQMQTREAAPPPAEDTPSEGAQVGQGSSALPGENDSKVAARAPGSSKGPRKTRELRRSGLDGGVVDGD